MAGLSKQAKLTSEMACMDFRNLSEKAGKISALKSDCSSGKLDSCYRLGFAYELGFDVDRDLKLATEILLRTCHAGQKDACARMRGEKLRFTRN